MVPFLMSFQLNVTTKGMRQRDRVPGRGDITAFLLDKSAPPPGQVSHRAAIFVGFIRSRFAQIFVLGVRLLASSLGCHWARSLDSSLVGQQIIRKEECPTRANSTYDIKMSSLLPSNHAAEGEEPTLFFFLLMKHPDLAGVTRMKNHTFPANTE